MHRRKFKVNSISADRTTDSGINKASSKNLCLSQKIIREFKKSEINKYGASPSCPDAPRTITTEWQVLYTTQLTQKVKKFHDGFLKLAIYGSQRRQFVTPQASRVSQVSRVLKHDMHFGTWPILQRFMLSDQLVMLYDESRRLLNSRFLKTNEMIRSGESLMLEGHLVDIGELEGDHEPLIYSNAQERNVNVIEKEILHVQQVKKLKTQKTNPMEFKRSEISEQDVSPSCPDTTRTSGMEWEVLYTTQLTQKAKKFHDGILKLTLCGSERRQVTLLAEDGTSLSHRYLKLSEHLNAGSTCELSNYLVEVGELHKHSDEHLQKITSVWKDTDSCIRSSSVENIKLSRRVPANKPLSNELQSNASPQKESDSTVRSSQAENSKTSRETFTNKPLRDAHAILSILKKPAFQEGIGSGSLKGESVEVCHASRTSDFTHFDIQNGVQGQRVEGSHSQSSVVEDNKNQEAIITYNYNGDISNINPSNNRGDDPQPKIITSSSFSLGSGASNISRPVFDLEFSDSCRRSHTSSILNPQVINGHSDCQTPTASVSHDDGSSGNKEIKNIPELISSKAASSFSYSQSFKEVYPGKLSQACSDDIGIGSRCNEASDHCDVEWKSPIKCITDELPSFDLGF